MRGRPTKYRKEFIRTIEKYHKNCIKKGQIPFIEDIALLLGVNDDTINEWSKAKSDFSATIKKIKLLQRMMLKRNGLEGKVNTTMAIFLLKTEHGMIEPQYLRDRDDPEEAIALVVSKAPESPN